MRALSSIWSVFLFLISLAGCGIRYPAQETLSPGPTAVSHFPTRTLEPSSTSAPIPTNTVRPTTTSIPTLPPPTSTPQALPAQVVNIRNELQTEVEELRGLSTDVPIARHLMTRQELTAYLERKFTEEYPPAEIEADVRTMAAFDFVPEDLDLRRVLLDLYSSQILGLYDEEENLFYIVSKGDFDLVDQITFVHEYVHGLQDIYYQLEIFVDDDRMNDDQVLARMAVAEGDATLVMSKYLLAHLAEWTPQDLALLQSEDFEGDQEVLETAPPIIRETFQFPYIYGLQFVEYLQGKGWTTVDPAFTRPPQSTEQILHPEKYLSGDEPQIIALPPLTDTLGTGWRLVEIETLGEFQTRLYLAQQVDPETADLASQGWDGDQYALYARDGEQVLVFVSAWDSQADREEFVAAWTQYATGKYRRPPSDKSQSELWWKTPSQTALLTWSHVTAAIILAPDQDLIEKVLTAFP